MSLALATQGLDPQLSSGDFPLRLKESLKTYSTHILPGHAIPSGSLLGGPTIARFSRLPMHDLTLHSLMLRCGSRALRLHRGDSTRDPIRRKPDADG
jgi:hypothetical protein